MGESEDPADERQGTEDQDVRDEEAQRVRERPGRDDEDEEPGPRSTASPRTQQDAGLTGGIGEAEEGERVGPQHDAAEDRTEDGDEPDTT